MKSSAILAVTAALATTAVSAYKQGGGPGFGPDFGPGSGPGNGIHSKPDLFGPGIQVETRPPIIVVQTVTRTKSWNARPTVQPPHWKPKKHYYQYKEHGKGNGYKHKGNSHEDYDEHKGNSHGDYDDDNDYDQGKNKWKKHGKGGKYDKDEKDEGKNKWKKHGKGGYDDNIHANSLASADIDVEAAEASNLVDFAAAQASSTSSGGGMISSAIASKTSSIASKMTSAVSSATHSAVASASGAENVRVGGTFVAAAAGIAAYLLL